MTSSPNSAGTVTNSGTISGTNGAGVGVDLYAGSVDNTGLIKGHGGVDITSAAGTVTNSGTIMASGTGGFGVYLAAGGTIIDSGAINGASGTAVSFGGAGGNRLVLDPSDDLGGKAAGSTSAGATNTLELAAAAGIGTVSGLGTQFANFGTVTVDAGAQWALGGMLIGAGTPSRYRHADRSRYADQCRRGSGDLDRRPGEPRRQRPRSGPDRDPVGRGRLSRQRGNRHDRGCRGRGLRHRRRCGRHQPSQILGTGSFGVGISLKAGGSVGNSGLIAGASGIIGSNAASTADTVVNFGTIAGTGGAGIALGSGTDREFINSGTISVRVAQRSSSAAVSTPSWSNREPYSPGHSPDSGRSTRSTWRRPRRRGRCFRGRRWAARCR